VELRARAINDLRVAAGASVRSPQETIFDLRGLDQHIKPLQEACGWQ
jgi:hypothetical protein